MRYGFALLILGLTACTTPAYLIRQTSEPRGGEIEMISPDGDSFNETRRRADMLMTEVCGAAEPTVVATQSQEVPYYSIAQDGTVVQKRQYLTFRCAQGPSSRMPASVPSK